MTKRTRVCTLSVFVVSIFMCSFWTAAFAEGGADDPLQKQFIEGMRDRAQGNLYDAIAAFDNILANKPQLHRARLELAVTYYRLYDYDKARAMAQKVLDDPKTPPNVRVSVLAFMAQIDKDANDMSPGHSWKPSVGLGWLYDTNVNAGPGADFFEIGGQIWTLNPSSQPTSDGAAVLTAGLNHQYRTGKTVKIGQKNALLLWQSHANYYRRDYFSEHAFDQDVITVGTGPALVSVHNWRANVDAQVDYIRLGSEDLARFYSLLPTFTKQLANGAWEVTLDGTLTSRDYTQDVNDGRDSTYYSGQLSVGRVFKKARVSLQVGTSLLREDADVDYYGYDGRGVYAGIAWRPWLAGSVFGRVDERYLDYDGLEPVFNVARDERVRQYTLGVSYTIKSAKKWLNDLTVSASFVGTRNFSNVSTHEYDRDQTTITLNKTF